MIGRVTGQVKHLALELAYAEHLVVLEQNVERALEGAGRQVVDRPKLLLDLRDSPTDRDGAG